MQANNILAEGGVMQEGGTVDPVSGNQVPPGAMKEEVRDDIDAKLSEGEFVFPADVVRYFGLQKLMAMRDEAKTGLQKMNEIGQMGNADQVSNPEALHSAPAPAAPAADFGKEVDMALAETGSTEQAFAYGGTPDATQAKTETYVNQAGQKIYVPMSNGNPIIDIPMGFTKQEETMQQPAFAGGGLAPYGMRHSGDAPKGKGYFGELKHASGDTATELSSEFEYNGKTVEHPLIVPTLTKSEINHLLSGKQPTDEIYNKAESWAKSRIEQGKSPFAEPTEVRMPVPEDEPKMFTGGLAKKRKKK